jgi:hypothetical protein
MKHFHRPVVSAGAIIWVTLGCVSCAARVALPLPYPLTYGGTTIPAKGVAGGLEFGDGLGGQERQRAEILNFNLGIGVADRISVSGAMYGRPGAFSIMGHDPMGSLWRVKARLGELFEARSSVSVHVGLATVDRTSLPAQRESLRTVDVAVPAEFLLTDPAERRKVSVYVGPRATRESYRDYLDPRQDVQDVYGGVLGGVHLADGVLHLFGEVTLLYVPENTFHNVTYGGRLTVMPAVGVLLRLGTDHKWKSR